MTTTRPLTTKQLLKRRENELNGIILNAAFSEDKLSGLEERLVDLEGRITRLEGSLEGIDYNDEPATLAGAVKINALLTNENMRLLLDLIGKKVVKECAPTPEEMAEGLPIITGKESLTVYISQVTRQLLHKKITGPEARTLLYAAQLAMQGRTDDALETTQRQLPQPPAA